MPYDLRRLENVRDYAYRAGHTVDVIALNDAIREITDLRQALLWYVREDETNTGDHPVAELRGATWNQMNEYWIDGQNRARALLGLEPI